MVSRSSSTPARSVPARRSRSSAALPTSTRRPARAARSTSSSSRDRGARRGGPSGVLLAEHPDLAEDVIPALDAKTVAAGQELPPLEKGPITRDHLRAY